jgi:N4-gp56 family major capsid protein
MALTNFNNLTTEEKTMWSMDFWKVARNNSFISQFAGKGANSMVQRVTELKKSEKGARAVISLIADLEGDGVMGDSTLEGNEEEIKSYDQVINIDQLRNANRLEGRLADQKSIVNFRSASRDVLAYWAADRIDQLAFLTLSGIEYDTRTNGAVRPVLAAGRNLSDLEFNPTAAGVVGARPPSDDRHFRWDSTVNDWKAGDTTAVVAGDTITYASLVWAKSMAKNKFIRGIKTGGGEEVFHVFLTPTAMATLRLDADYMANVRNAAPRSKNNELFAGTSSTMVDGMVIHEFRHVFNTQGLASGSKWGGTGVVDGCRALFCGAQALGMADIGNAYWEEDDFDYANSPGISVGKMLGFLKPKFNSLYSNTAEPVQDFGVMALDYSTTHGAV